MSYSAGLWRKKPFHSLLPNRTIAAKWEIQFDCIVWCVANEAKKGVVLGLLVGKGQQFRCQSMYKLEKQKNMKPSLCSVFLLLLKI